MSQNEVQEEMKVIKASPTKDFFIQMLVKDIKLIPAIIDLVDNCIDGARRLRGGDNYSDITIRIEATDAYFKISDTCGGMSVEIAKNYAFRFGRPEEMPTTPHSMGQFGVGMKRALFKLGKKFTIKSTTAESSFEVVVDVDEWKRKEEGAEWTFEFSELNLSLPQTPPKENQGTIITVTVLHESVANEFKLDNFLARLKTKIEEKHQDALSKGLEITLNGIPLDVSITELFLSDIFRPIHKVFTIEDPQPPINVKVYTGIYKSLPADAAGWYVYCNGRSILEADQTKATGWGEVEGIRIPMFHPEYNMFRGYVFFDCDDAARLPWNTTKTGFDEDSLLYRYVREEMITAMRPVIDFLNRYHSEKSREIDTPVTKMIETALDDRGQSIELSNIEPADTFLAPTKEVPKKPIERKSRILYSIPTDKVEKVKKVLGVKTFREVGERTFDYFYEIECED